MNSLRGFLAGSLMTAGLINYFNAAGQITLFIIGLLVLIDSLMLHGRDTHIATTLFFAVMGGVVSIFLTLLYYGFVYIAVVIVAIFLLYLHRLTKSKRSLRIFRRKTKGKEDYRQDAGKDTREDSIELVDL